MPRCLLEQQKSRLSKSAKGIGIINKNVSDKESMRQFNYYGQTRLGDFNGNDIEGL
jgi:hypothetical protein